MKRNSWIVIVLLLFINIGHTQSNTKVLGKVFTFKNTPLEGVQVVFKKSKKDIFTDSSGVFKIGFTKKDVLYLKQMDLIRIA